MTRTSHSRAPPGNSGECTAAEAIRGFDWHATDVGPHAAWSQSLRSSVELLLQADEPMALVWGPRQTVFLNDAWVGEVGSADALGREAPSLTGFPWPDLAEALAGAAAEGAARRIEAPGASLFRLLPLFDERGDATGLMIRALPVPGARRDWLPSILDHGGAGVVDWDPASDVLDWSRGLSAVLGAPARDRRPGLDHLAARADPEDREQLRAAFEGAPEATHPVEVPATVVAADGSNRTWKLTVLSLRDADRASARVIGVVRDETELADARRRLRLLHGELQHRVRNILAVTRSLMRRTARTAETIDAFVNHLDGRIGALARLQSMLLRDPEAKVDFETILREELLSAAASEESFSLSGPVLKLPLGMAQTVSLMLHELATNALKFGALSEPGGRLEVAWQSDGNSVQFTWRELDVPLLAAPSSKGVGLEMLEQVLPYETGGHAVYSFEPGGFACSVSLPLPTAATAAPSS